VWHVDPLVRNDREISIYTTAFTRQWSKNSNRGTVFSVRSMPKYYKQGQLTVGVSLLMNESDNRLGSVFVSCFCEKLVAEVGDSSGTQTKWNVRR
jgi:hypothetical protein